MKEDFSYGVIVFDKGMHKILLLEHVVGHFGFPKGHRNDGETDKDAGVRELREEAGISVDLMEKTFTQNYQFKFNGELIYKTVLYWVGVLKDNQEVKIDNKEIKSFIWITISDAIEKLSDLPSSVKLLKEIQLWLSERNHD